ncbi:hypothetical protein NLU13_2480 [Sarocladium strictum]|uniref:Secreted protein n=1 Tax=Sarocladium strictum TaxID=5046 RepID=A0AA39GLN2_SARSR|nr:hypothetical protein NLU13_2480 [Sarocladium strictum]
MRFSAIFVAVTLWALEGKAQSWDVDGVRIVCNPKEPKPADVISSRANAQYLSKITTGEKPTNGAGPENCGQVACNWGSSIEWCNNTPQPKTLDNFTVIADAWKLMNSKLVTGTPEDCVILQIGALSVSGEVFHPDGFSVRVKGGVSC